MKAPAFLFYVGDFLSSPDVQMMDTLEIGAYCLLLFNAWQGDLHGHLPNNEDKLRRLTKLSPEQWAVSREILLGKFPVADGGHTRYNPRMVAEAEKQENYRLRQAENGKRGGRPKKPNESQNNPPLFDTNPTLSKTKANTNPNESFSISSSITTKEEHAGSAGKDSASPAESQKQTSESTGGAAKKPAEYRYDEAPVFLSQNFAVYLLSIGYGYVDKAMYLLRISAGAKKAVEKKRLAEQAPNEAWQGYIQKWLDNDKRDGRLLLPDSTISNAQANAVGRPSYGPAPTPTVMRGSINQMVQAQAKKDYF